MLDRDAVMAQSIDQALALWFIREGVGALQATTRPNIDFDVSVPQNRMGALVETLCARLAAGHPNRQHLPCGHLGDGNLHLLTGPYADPYELLTLEQQVYFAVQDVHGGISAGHRIAVVKESFLKYSRNKPEIEVMQRLKSALDPDTTLNRGQIFDAVDLRP